ncbi:MAG: dTDP-4-dehydrorhamnose 3,5-epimerase family protein [Simkania sp.]|nr:dTDP-4-dehydrorhamnose 3,5-epimerase family protein [Simkania sp.]
MSTLILEKKLTVQKTPLEGVLLITPPTIFDDFRGDFVEIYNQELYQNAGITAEFVQDDYATSTKHVLRGIHGDDKTGKLVKCLYGTLYMLIVNNDSSSKEYKEWTSFTLNCRNHSQLYIPPKFGTSYLVMSDKAILHYKQTAYYHNAKQFTIKWNDPEYDFWWPILNPITSERDYPFNTR